MGGYSAKIELSTDLTALQSSMNGAAATVQGAADKMVASGKLAQTAWERVAQASLAHAQAQSLVKAATAAATAESTKGAEAMQLLASSQKLASRTAAELAAAQKATQVATQETTSKMNEGKAAAALLGEETGIRLNRHLRSVAASSTLLGPLLKAAFPVAVALGFVEALSVIPEHFQKIIDAMSGWNEAARKSFESQIAANNIYLESLDKQRTKRAEIEAMGTTGQAKIHAEQVVTNTELDAEIAKRGRQASQLREINQILESRKASTTEAPLAGQPLTDSGESGTLTPRRALPPQFTSDKEAQAHADELVKLVAESDAKIAQLRLTSGQGTAKQLTVEAATEARAQTEAQIKATKDQAEAHAEFVRKNAELDFQMGKITLAMEVQAFRDANNQKLAAEIAYLEGRKRLELQHAKDTPGYQAGPHITVLNTQETIARERARTDQRAIDAKFFQDQYEAQKQAFENQIAAAKPASQQRVQLEQQLSDYVRSVWDADSKQYREIVRQRAEAEREWAQAQKLAMQEASRATDEYLRKRAELQAQGAYEQNAGQLKTQEIAIRGQAQAGALSPTTELTQMAAIHQREVAMDLTANQEKLQALADYIAKRRALLADLGGLDSQDPEARKLVQDIQTANLQTQQLENQRIQIQQKAAQTAMQDENNILKQREQAWKEFSQSIAHDATTGLNPWIERHKTIGQAAAQTWNSIAMSAITAIEKMGERWVMQHLLMAAAHKIFKAQEVATDVAANAAKTAVTSATNVAAATSNAAVAATAAGAAVAGIPIIGPALVAPTMAATLAQEMTFTAGAAFELGGVVPKTQVALVHGGERVLTPSQNNTFERMVERGGGGHTFNFPTHIGSMQGLDGASVRSMLEEHGDLVGRIAVAAVQRHMRRNGV